MLSWPTASPVTKIKESHEERLFAKTHASNDHGEQGGTVSQQMLTQAKKKFFFLLYTKD